MMTKERYTKIITVIAQSLWVVVLGCGYIGDFMLNFIKIVFSTPRNKAD